MEFEQQKKSLLEKGNQLLTLVKKQNVEMGVPQDVLDSNHRKELQQWYFDTEEFMERFGLECQKERFKSSSWIINGVRVGVGNIKNILEIIERVKVN